jgi:hypothetical protein
MNSLKQGWPLSGKPQPTRYPLARPPSARPSCGSGHADAHGSTPESRGSTRLQSEEGGPEQKNSAEVRDQVKKLQFWLRVFSRFCQDEAEQD